MNRERPARLTSIPPEIAAVTDYEPYARERLDDNAWAYIASGAADELTLGWNRAAFDRIRLNPRVLRDLRGGNTRVQLFGREFAHPILLAPVAYQRLAHPDGELATAYAAGAVGAGMVVSGFASATIEDIAQVAADSGAPLWFQLYFVPDRGFTLSLVERAEAAGYEALVVTVDAPIAGIRNREQRARFRLPPGVEPVNLRGMPQTGQPALEPGQSMVFDAALASAPTWADLEWLRARTRLPIVVKGILAAEDAQIAAELGLAGVVVSNHGGRTIDTLPASLEALPAIAERVGDRLPVLLDGGIRRGTDIVKALALGARAVLVGRPWVYGLAAAGPLGVAHVVKLLREELEVAMALTGCARLADIGPGAVWPASAVRSGPRDGNPAG